MRRPERMAEALREAVSEIVGFEMNDPRLFAVTVTDVRVADNLRDASVYVIVEGEEKEILEAMKALQKASSYVRVRVAQDMGLRHAPLINFVRDTVEEKARRIDLVLETLELDRDSSADES